MRSILPRSAALIGVLAIASAAAAQPVTAKPRARGRIDAWRGIAGVRVGMKLTEALRVLGRPTTHDAEQLFYKKLDLTIRVAAIDDHHPRRVWSIGAGVPEALSGLPVRSDYVRYRDARGIGTDSTRAELTATYPQRRCSDSIDCYVEKRRNADGLCVDMSFSFEPANRPLGQLRTIGVGISRCPPVPGVED